MLFFFWWHRIFAATAPRVATQNSFQSQPQTFNRAVYADSFQHILRAGRLKAAYSGAQRGNKIAIELNR